MCGHGRAKDGEVILVREKGDGAWHDDWYGVVCVVREAVPQELSLFGSVSHVLSSSQSAC